MVTVVIEDKYADTLSTLGDLDTAVQRALQRYTIEQITTKINELQGQSLVYADRYGMDIGSFRQRASTDEAFIDYIEATISKTWELDLADWEFCQYGVEDWTQKLQTILLK